jgi:putative transposon-encoded protein
MSTKRVVEKPVSIQMEGYEIVEKTAKASGTTARVLVPRHWIGKRVRVVRLEP